MPADDQPMESRRKRAKIVSACTECRRKKTKCNGEQPCRSCHKSSVSCVYPSAHADDRRNVPSKAALEAIEERLKAIENLLKVVLQHYAPSLDLDPNTVDGFLRRQPSSLHARPQLSHPPQLQTQHDIRLPSIHSLSAPSGRHDVYPLPQQNGKQVKTEDYTRHVRYG